MVSSIVLPIKKVNSLVDSKILVEIKDENCKFEGTLAAMDEYLNLHLEDAVEILHDKKINLGTVVIRGNNILSISPIN
ncbi:MAG TPA: ribonucleoprotein [Methanocorpusculum sp.]|nr:ribonucleoprotein [Methanocorpusculum sp.]